jgi:hypothetical protein
MSNYVAFRGRAPRLLVLLIALAADFAVLAFLGFLLIGVRQ